MDHLEFLQGYSELAVAIVGFSGIVLAVQRLSDKRSPLQKIAMSMLIGFGAASLILSIIPQILLEADVEPETTWRVMSILVLLTQIVGRFVRGRQTRQESAKLSELAGWSVLVLLLTSLLLAASNIYFALFWVFMLNLLIYLVVGILIFASLLQDDEADA